MNLTLELPMGNEQKQKDQEEDKHVRVTRDLVNMIGWIHHFRKLEAAKAGLPKPSVAQILDPMLRKPVLKAYAPYAARVRKIEEAESEVTESEPPQENRPKV